MAKDHDFKRLVRERMQDTGERYTQARAALIAQRKQVIRSSATARAAW